MDSYPEYLDEGAKNLLEQGRMQYADLGLDRATRIEIGEGKVALFPWIGWNGLGTLSIALKQRGVENQIDGVAIVCRASEASVVGALEQLNDELDLDPVSIAIDMTPYQRAKYDWALTDELLIDAIAEDNVDMEEMRIGVERLLVSC